MIELDVWQIRNVSLFVHKHVQQIAENHFVIQVLKIPIRK